MARGEPLLSVFVSGEAASDLEEIYRHNPKRRGIAAAERWERFLRTRIANLAVVYGAGKLVESRPDLLYIVMKKSARGKDGHIAVYRIDKVRLTVRVLHVFHTKQDWENKL